MLGELEKIDIIKERMGVSYREAQEALENAEGDLIQALIMLEENKGHGWTESLIEQGDKVAGHIKTYINHGNKTKVKLKKGDKTIAEFPATAGILGIVATLASTQLALVAGIGAVAAVAKKVHLEIEKPDGDTKVVSLDKHRKE